MINGYSQPTFLQTVVEYFPISTMSGIVLVTEDEMMTKIYFLPLRYSCASDEDREINR